MSSNLHLGWARLLVRSLFAAGARDAVLSPGSRSTPLALALDDGPLALRVISDERSAAFYALGQARVTSRPTVLVCTSGTAGAHYLPAIIEASESHLPLVAITADRPWELLHAAAPQTIDQDRLFGAFTRFFADVGAPDDGALSLRAVARLAAQAVAASLGPVPGPVHLNARFRKPLEPVTVTSPASWERVAADLAARGPTRVLAATPALPAADLDALAHRIEKAERGLIVAGPTAMPAGAERDAVFELARQSGFPLLAEATSQLRFARAPEGVLRVGALDVVLRVDAARAALRPDLVIQIGRPPTSTGFAELAGEGAPRIAIAPHGWNDPWSDAEAMVVAPIAGVVRELSARLSADASHDPWRAAWRRADALAAAAVEGELGEGALVEGQVARAVVGALPEHAVLAVGNSAPVRDLDLWATPTDKTIDVVHQRGASGIDGLVSSAAGAAASARRPTVLLLGDVSLAHDVGALALLADAEVPIVVVAVDNAGGRIFETLPVGAAISSDRLERLFATPPRVDWEKAAAAFGVAFAEVHAAGALGAALAAALARPGGTLIRAVVPRTDAAARARRVRATFAAAFAASPELRHSRQDDAAPAARRGERS
jgi:2-succinyl-5-enolpyruvyl-6-hydroxy-3-cyclohexene-1-carboxylate synthase